MVVEGVNLERKHMTENPFKFFDFSEEEVKKVNEEMKTIRVERDARICICGHAVSRHGGVDIGATYCSPSKMQCPCRNIKAVVEAQDSRDFLNKTIGSGPMHALGRGIQSSMERSHWVKWIIDPVCEMCGKDSQISPVPISQQGVVLYEASGWNALLCRNCRGEA